MKKGYKWYVARFADSPVTAGYASSVHNILSDGKVIRNDDGDHAKTKLELTSARARRRESVNWEHRKGKEATEICLQEAKDACACRTRFEAFLCHNSWGLSASTDERAVGAGRRGGFAALRANIGGRPSIPERAAFGTERAGKRLDP
jgi:hypothetical protein